jgi:hypothetical protein
VLDGCRLLVGTSFVGLEMNEKSCGFGREGALALALVEAGFLLGAMMKDENVL